MSQDMNEFEGYSFYATTIQASIFKSLIESIKEILPDTTIEVSNEVNSEELMVVDAESNDEDFTNESTNEPDDEGENWFE